MVLGYNEWGQRKSCWEARLSRAIVSTLIMHANFFDLHLIPFQSLLKAA